MGPERFGIYSYVFALTTILAIPAQMGLPRLVVRETSRAHVHEDWARMLGVWRWAGASALILSSVVSGVAIGCAIFARNEFESSELETFYWGLALMVLIALSRIRGAVLEGLRRVVLGQVADNVVRPFSFIVMVVVFVSVFSDGELSSAAAMALHVVAAGLALAVGTWYMTRNYPAGIRVVPAPIYEGRDWFSATLPLALVSALQQVNTYADIVMLGIFSSAEDVGAYRLAAQGGMLVVFGLQIVSMFLAPYISRIHAQNDIIRLQMLATWAARFSLVIALLAVVILWGWGGYLLVWFFGEQYLVAYEPMMLLALGQAINAFFGPTGVILSMTGYAQDAARGVAVAAVCNIVLNLILIPCFGMVGAATATAVTLAIWNFLLWGSVRRRLGISCTPFVGIGARGT